MNARTLRGKVAIVGVGETRYYKRGTSPDPEFCMGLEAILAAAADAGVDPSEIDGFASFHDERSTPIRLASALGVKELRFSNLVWGGGGGGGAAAIGNAAAAIAAGTAECVVVYRSLVQSASRRIGQGSMQSTVDGANALTVPYGMITPAQQFAMKVTRYMYDHGIERDALRAISLASYHHAQMNPRAVMHGKPLTPQAYDESRWIVEPFRLFDCCMENDGAAALILMPAERAADISASPVYILAAEQGGDYRGAARCHNAPLYATSGFSTLAPRLFEHAGVKPKDIKVVQAYENFTGGVVMSLAEHGFFEPDEANDFLVLDNLIAPTGKLPLNTSGGNLAECYMHGLELQIETVRQLRNQSTAQVAGADLGIVISGPMVNPVSNMILGTAATL
ncbi:thiolase C-terminal domain-containing protein [Bordetella tumulicola]|uniref:thiolase C-terminal domain-containing protein n=1 Tax=Bordetella tumulicola TaxID=1649133 RepID=UPI0039F05037